VLVEVKVRVRLPQGEVDAVPQLVAVCKVLECIGDAVPPEQILEALHADASWWRVGLGARRREALLRLRASAWCEHERERE
jgi:hypothetical protein